MNGSRRNGSATNEETYTYDKRGNLTETIKNGNLVNQYHFGALNRLEKAVNHQTGEASTYQYNGLGHRVGKTIGTPIEPNLPTSKLQDLTINPMKQIEDTVDLTKQYHNLLQRTENNTTTAYTWDSNVLHAVEAGNNVSEQNNNNYQYLQDELGSPIRVIGEESQQEVYGYGEFGQEMVESENARGFIQPFTYTGYQKDSVANTYYAQAREYVSTTGRFTGEDIIKGNGAYPFTLNQYAYCIQNPLKYVDLNGKEYIIVWSYAQKDVKAFETYMNKNHGTSLKVDGNTEDWKGSTYREFDSRDSFARAAYTKRQELIEQGVKSSEIVVQRIDSNIQLMNTWNDKWSEYDKVEGLYFYSHGYSGGAEVYGGSKDFWSNPKKLNFTEYAKAVFYGCNTANGSFAQEFANKQGVTTYAQNDFSSFSYSESSWQRIKTHDDTLGVYLYPMTWGFNTFSYEMQFFWSKWTEYQTVFGRWNHTGEGIRFEPECDN